MRAGLALIESDRLQVVPPSRKNEVVGFLRGGLDDLSISRSRARAHGWGIPVRVDPRLREVDVGSWAGRSMDEVGAEVPDFWPALREGRDFRRSETGETATESGQRVALAVLEHAEAAPGDEVLLVVGHGLSLRVGALLLMFSPLALVSAMAVE